MTVQPHQRGDAVTRIRGSALPHRRRRGWWVTPRWLTRDAGRAMHRASVEIEATAVTPARQGLVHGLAAYTLWGIAPLYWKLLASVGPVEVIAHRVVWGVVAFAAIVWFTGAAPAVRAAMSDRRTLAVMALSGTVLA